VSEFNAILSPKSEEDRHERVVALIGEVVSLRERLREVLGQEADDETLKEAKEIVDDPYTYGARVASIVHEMILDRAHWKVKTRIAQLEREAETKNVRLSEKWQETIRAYDETENRLQARIAQLEADFKLAKQVAESEAERANKLERVREGPFIWLIEWQYKTGGVESSWPDEWEPDHNSGVWFTEDGAKATLATRAFQDVYTYRIARWSRAET